MAFNTGKKVVVDYTEGNIPRQLIVFAIPFILANLLQQLYNVVDMVVVGQFCGSAGLAAVTIGGQAVQLVTSVCMGFSNGGQILVSQYIGCKDTKGAGQVAGTMFSFIALLALVFAVLCVAFRRTFLTWLNTPEASFGQASQYLVICSFGYVFVSGYNACCALLRGAGDSRRPLVYVGVSSVINLILDLVFVAGLKMEAAGAATATVIAQVIACIVAFRSVFRHRDEFGMPKGLAAFRVDRRKLSAFLKLGTPLAIQMSAIQLSMLFVNSYVNAYGVAAAATMGVGRKLQQFCNLITMGIRQAGSSMIGQNFAARRHDRVSGIVRISILLSMIPCAVFSLLAIFVPKIFFRFFTQDPEVLALAPVFMRILVFAFIAGAFMAGYQAMIQGIGFSAFSMATAILDGVVFRIGLSMLFGVWLNWGLTGLFLGNNLAIYATLIPAMIYYYSGAWKKRRVLVDS